MPKRVAKRSTFTVDLYKVDVEIVVLHTNKDVAYRARQLLRKYGWDTTEVPGECCGYAATFTQEAGTFHLLLSLESLDINTITHETDHIRNYIMNHAGITEDPEGSREASATLNAYINEKVFRFLHTNNLSIKMD